MKYLILLILFVTVALSQTSERVSLQLQWKHQFEFAGFYIAKEKGYYSDIGLDVEIKEFESNTDIIDDVVESKTTYATSYPGIVLEKSKGKEVVLLSAILQSSPHILVSLKSSNIKTIRDFKNKKIMIIDNIVQTAPFQSMFHSNYISIKDMELVEQTFNIEDLIDGKVDIISSFSSNELYTLDKQNIPYDVWDPKEYGFEYYDVILFTSQNELDNNPKRVYEFNKASLKGWEYAFDNIEETVDLILKKYNTQNKTKEALIYEANTLKKLAYINTKEIGKIDKQNIKRIYDVYNVMGLTKDKINFDKFIYKSKEDMKNLTIQEELYLKNKKQITMCIDPDWMPFESFDKKGNHIGLSSDFFNIFRKHIEIPINVIQTKTWNETLDFAKDKKCDIISLAMETPKRKKYLNFTTPYLKVPLVLATKMDVPFVNDFKTLTEHKLGIPKGYAFIELLQNKYPNLNIVEVENVKDGLQKVIDNELYGYIGTLPSVGYLFQSDFVGQLKIAGKFDESWSLGTAVRDDDRILLQIMNKLIYNLDETAKSKILSNSFSIKYQQDIDYSVVYKVLVFIMVVALFFIYRQYILKNQNKRLKTLVDERTKDLNELNKNLEDKVEEKTKELLQQEETFRLLFDIAPIFIDSFDKDGRCVLWNKECEKVFGWTIDDINRSKNSLELFYPDPKVQKDAIDTIINKPEKIFREWYPLNKKGETLVTMWAHIYLPNGEIINVGYDITEEKAKDKLLAEQLKMAAMGEMIGNIAHQWRQPLSVISTASSGMQIQKEYGILTDEQFIESCKAINSNTQFLSKTIDNFRDFIKNDKVKSTFKLDNAIGSFINIVEATIKIDNINMVFDLQENINIDSFQNELIQCLINIFHNSDDVLSKNKLEDKFIFLSTSLKNNKVIIKIKDNGGGIDDDILPKIFEPYFTTKHQSQGTGLGLHMTYNSIVNGMDGTIEANNIAFEYNGKEYTGAEFTITLPAN